MCMDDIEAWGNDRYWRVVGTQEVRINYYKLSKTCHHTQVDSIGDLLGMRAVERSYQRELTGRLLVSAFGI